MSGSVRARWNTIAMPPRKMARVGSSANVTSTGGGRERKGLADVLDFEVGILGQDPYCRADCRDLARRDCLRVRAGVRPIRLVLSALHILWRNPPAMSPGPSFASTPECASPRSPPWASRASNSTSASGSDSVHTARLRTRHSSVTPSSV